MRKQRRSLAARVLLCAVVAGCGARKVSDWEQFTIPASSKNPVDPFPTPPVAWTAPGAPIFVIGAGRLYRIDDDGLREERAAHQAAGGSGERRYLAAVVGTGPTDVWVDGLAHFDGQSWRGSNLSSDTFAGGALFGARPDFYFLYSLYSLHTGNRLWIYDGSQWNETQQDLPSELYDGALHGSGPNDVHLVGRSRGGQARALHYDGSRWKDLPVPIPRRAEEEAGDVLSMRLTVWARGSTEAYAGSAWLADLEPDPAGMILDEGGHLIRFDGTSWREIASPTSEPISKVAGCDARLYVATASAVHERDEQGRWRAIFGASSEHIVRDVYCGGALIVSECRRGRPEQYECTEEMEVTVWVRR